MPKYYPYELIDGVKKRLEQGTQIHTLILWTKHPRSLLINPLYNFLQELKAEKIQLFLQLTITGMGNLIIGKKSNGNPLIIEPNAPPFLEALSTLPQVIKLLENPQRIRLRIDPVIRIKDSQGKIFSNIKYLPVIISKTQHYGIKQFSFSFLESNYQKVDRRFKKLGCTILPPDSSERKKTGQWLEKLQTKFDVDIYACCVPSFSDSKCIDGELLARLHDYNEPADLSQPRKREKCGCTQSIDIGGWPPKRCYTGCDYCYAFANYNN